MKAIGTTDEVKARLMLRGWRSMSAWARENGYLPVTVRMAVSIWGLRTDKEPHGGLNRQIIKKLRADLARPTKALSE